MAEADRKADQQRRCNDGFLYCFNNCGIVVMKGERCTEYLCNKSYDDSYAAYQTLFAEEEAQAEKNKVAYEARQSALKAEKESSSSTGGDASNKTGNGAIDKTWEKHISAHVSKESAYWDSIKGKWGDDWENDIMFKLQKIYESEYFRKNGLDICPDGGKEDMLNLMRNTAGAMEKHGGVKTEREMLDNIVTLLNEAESAGILA